MIYMDERDSNTVEDTLNFFILHTLRHGPLHGFAIEQHIERIYNLLRFAAERDGKPRPEPLPAALRRLERIGWVEIEGRQADFSLEKIYSLTSVGREQLTAQQTRWTSTLAHFIDEGSLDNSFRRFLDRNM